MASRDISIKGIRFRLTPLSGEKGYANIGMFDRLKFGRAYTIYTYDCSKTPPGGQIPRQWPVPADTDFRDLDDLAGPLKELKAKAKFADLLMATDLSPSGWRKTVDAQVGPMPKVTLDPRTILARYRDYKFKIVVTVDYVYMMARPVLTAAQRRNPIIRALARRHLMIGIPVKIDVSIAFSGRCDPSKPRLTFIELTAPNVTPAEGFKPLIDEHDENQKKLDQSNGLFPHPWGGEFHEDLEPEPEEEEPVDPQEEPLNPFEEFMFELYDLIELAEVLEDLEQNPPTPEELGED